MAVSRVRGETAPVPAARQKAADAPVARSRVAATGTADGGSKAAIVSFRSLGDPKGMGMVHRIHQSRLFGHAAAGFARAYDAALVALAEDVTDRVASRPGLVFAPHPDDETLGCGATILRKLDAGARVGVVIATDGRHSHRSAVLAPDALAALRRDEALSACAILGVPAESIRFLGYEDGGLSRAGEALHDDIRRSIAAFGPADLFVSAAVDTHEDHRALNAALRAVVAEAGRDVAVFEYPIWFEDPAAWVDRRAGPARKAVQAGIRPVLGLARLRPCIVRTGDHLAQKKAAIAAYRSQITNLTGEPGWAMLDPAFLRRFLGPHELFFRPDPAGADYNGRGS